MPDTCCPLSLDIYTVNGETIRFAQDNPVYARAILDDVQKQRLFTQRSIMIASVASVSNFSTTDVEMIKFRFPGPDDFPPILGIKDIREVSREDFEQRYLSLHVSDRIKMREIAEGEIIQTFNEIHLKSGNLLFLEFQIRKRSARDHIIGFRDAFHLPMLPFHIEGGGYGILNTDNITRLTTHPGPGTVPSMAWRAERGETRSVLDSARERDA